MSVKVLRSDREGRVNISIAEYNDLVRATEKIAALERFMAANDYVNAKDVISILNIKERTNEE